MYTKIQTDLIGRLTKSALLSKTIIVTLGTFVGSVFSYLLQIMLARMLSIEDFGTFTVLLSLSLIIGVFVSTFETSLVKKVSEMQAKGKSDVVTKLFNKMSISLIVLGFVFFVLIFLFREFLSAYLSISDVKIFNYFGVFFGISFLYLLPVAFLQGLQRFKAYSIFTSVSMGMRFAFPILFLLLGFGLGGVFVGMSVATLLSFGIGYIVLKRNFSSFDGSPLYPYIKDIFNFATAVLFVRVGMTLLNNIDVILVKHYFSSEEAGIYAGVVTMGKVLLFGASTVGLVMFPVITSAYNRKEDYMKKFIYLLFLQIIVILCGILLFSLFSNFITNIMFGSEYLPSAKYLPMFSVFMGLYVLINFLILFLLAIEKLKVFYLLIPTIVIQILLISGFHHSIVEVVIANLTVSASLLIGVVLFFIKNVGFNSSTRI